MLKRLLVPGILGLLVLPFAFAHPFPAPGATPCAPLHDHHYAAGGSVVAGTPVASASWRTTVVLTDSCATYDGEGDFGVGGGFLPADHHNAYEGVCVSDATATVAGAAPIAFWIGTTSPGGVVTAVSPLFYGCGYAPMPPGADGGWWIFLANQATAGPQTQLYSEPTLGHICSAPVWAC